MCILFDLIRRIRSQTGLLDKIVQIWFLLDPVDRLDLVVHHFLLDPVDRLDLVVHHFLLDPVDRLDLVVHHFLLDPVDPVGLVGLLGLGMYRC
jgi:hypothetical protein